MTEDPTEPVAPPRPSPRWPWLLGLVAVLAAAGAYLSAAQSAPFVNAWCSLFGCEAPLGRGSYAFVLTQPRNPERPVTFEVCTPIRLVVNDADLPEGAAGLLERATAAVTAASGHQFELAGGTDEAAGDNRALRDPQRYGPGFSPVLVAWTDGERFSALEGRTAGQAGSVAVRSPEGGQEFATGTVALDVDDFATMLDDDPVGDTATAVIMHELGHLVGLDHVDDPRQLMHPEPRRTTFGSGDLAGLRLVGAGADRCD